MKQAVELARMATDEAPCPTLDGLVRARLLAREKTTDPFGAHYSIACSGDDITVVSAGPDRRFDTADDVTSETPDRALATCAGSMPFTLPIEVALYGMIGLGIFASVGFVLVAQHGRAQRDGSPPS